MGYKYKGLQLQNILQKPRNFALIKRQSIQQVALGKMKFNYRKLKLDFYSSLSGKIFHEYINDFTMSCYNLKLLETIRRVFPSFSRQNYNFL